MTMDPHLQGFTSSANGIRLGNQSLPALQNQSLLAASGFENGLFDQSGDFHNLQSDLTSANTPSSSTVTHEEHPLEDYDLSDAVFGYISQILMEEDMEEKTCMLQDSLDLHTAEKSFYEVLGEKYPPSPERNLTLMNQNDWGQENNFSGNYSNGLSSNVDRNGTFAENSWLQNPSEFPSRNLQGNSVRRSSYSSSNSVLSSVERPLDSGNSILQVPHLHSESESILQFKKGVEEASKFLPSGNDLLGNLDVTNFIQEPKVRTDDSSVKFEKDNEESLLDRSKGKKQSERDEGDVEEERSSKQAAVYKESTLRSGMFDVFLLHSAGEGRNHLAVRREVFRNNSSKKMQSNGQSKASNSGKGRAKKQNGKKEVIDLRTLLVLCAQAVAADDHRNAHELLRQIRQHSTPFGDGNQRLANVFADGLEARLAGTGSQIYKGLISKRTSAADILKAYHLYIAACPFRKISDFTSNVMIRQSAAKAMRIHVIDFGILYGFQWPTLIQRISWRTGGPPKLRITGIDFPQPGFRPAERIEETGRRLTAYAESFKVPFEFNAIAKKWETIKLEELKIDGDEFLVVSCLYRAKNLLDESVAVDSPRNIFLNLIKKIKPDLFIHGIINGAFNAPFFVTRFREALYHYSSLFDMLDTIVPREDWERMLIEKEIFGREALNVIACEGCERVERPETYKQWQARILRAGFVQQPFSRELVQMAKEKVRSDYHKDFVIDEDSNWLLQGWKGRTVYAHSCWKPA